MIAAIGARGASYSITSKQPTRPSATTLGRPRTPAAARPKWRPPSSPAAAATSCAATAKPAKLRLITRRSRLLGAQGELWPNWRYHSFVTDRDDLDTKAATPTTGHSRARHQRPQRRLRAQPLVLRNGAWLACCVLAHNLARRPASGAPTPRGRGHHPQPAPHRAGPPRQPQPPPQTAPAAQLAMGTHLHHRPATNPQPAPTHLSRPQRPAQRSRTPPATNPHQPHTPILHAPKRAGPHTRTSPAAPGPNRRSHKPVGGFRLRARANRRQPTHKEPAIPRQLDVEAHLFARVLSLDPPAR